MKKVLIFDLDGTLLNTIADLGVACNTALRHYGFPEHSAAEYPLLVGNGVNKLIERALPEGKKTEENIQRLREVFIPYYDSHNRCHTIPYEGICETLLQLKQMGHKLAVASNKYDAAAQQLVSHYFPGIFDAVAGERDGVPRKPNPQIVYNLQQELNISAEDKEKVLYIGDSDVDMQTAKNAGLTAVGCTWGFCSRERLQNEHPDYLIDSPAEILSLL
ncbi:MAG: HAD family hydrolase [Paludibacter sp.]|nr:HAD family hydrolase [Bacteroidales bacterium]MCM1069375.1 HAD family hydrolase [Prevotella sp.]MCM1353895.1 HAD family hydrolase [Bacteroides sp.]MCM1442855.1 HAD family hydrolase [Muribaculum sp.]MCM1481900.1 HAD family hydrolase [Paludibacter sp.]